MLIWRGYGLVVPIVGFGALVAGNLAADSLMGEGYWAANDWPKVLAAAASAGLLWAIGRKLNDGPRRTVIDPASGLEFVHTPGAHSFFFVPVEWAGLALAALVLLVLAAI